MKRLFLAILCVLPFANHAAGAEETSPGLTLCAGEILREDIDETLLGGSVTTQDPDVVSASLLNVPRRRLDGSFGEGPELELRGLKAGSTSVRISAIAGQKSYPVVVSDCGTDPAPLKTLQVLEVCEGRQRNSTLESRVRVYSVFTGNPEVAGAEFRGRGRTLTLSGKTAGDAVVVFKAHEAVRNPDLETVLEPRVRKYLVKVAPCREDEDQSNFSPFSSG